MIEEINDDVYEINGVLVRILPKKVTEKKLLYIGYQLSKGYSGARTETSFNLDWELV